MSPRQMRNFRIDAELAAGLKLLREREGIPESEQIRRGIRMWLESRGVVSGKKAERSRGLVSKRKRS
jgi:hypothetical protein